MKNFKLTIFTFLLSLSVFGQEKPRLSISISGGKSLSLRNSDTQLTGNYWGELEGNGWATQLGLNYRFFKHFGLTARITYNQNHTREEGIELVALYYYKIFNITITDNKNWEAISAMVGPSLNFEVGSLGFEGRILAGYFPIKGSAFELLGVIGTEGFKASSTKGSSTSFGYGAGVTVSYKISHSISLIVNGDFTKTNVDFNHACGIAYPGATIFPQIYTLNQNFRVVNVTGGLKYSF